MIEAYDRRGQSRIWGGCDAKLIRDGDGSIGVYGPTGARLGRLVDDREALLTAETSESVPPLTVATIGLVILAVGYLCLHIGAAIARAP